MKNLEVIDSETNTEPLNSDLVVPVESSTLNMLLPDSGGTTITDAVIEPLVILFVSNASSVNAERGISNKSLPLPLNAPLTSLPINLSAVTSTSLANIVVDAEMLLSNVAGTFTSNPKLGEIDAVAEPEAILGESPESCAAGILNNPLPSPWNSDAVIDSETNSEPLILVLSPNSLHDTSASPGVWSAFTNKPPVIVVNVFTFIPPSGLRDAVTEPVAIKFDNNASGANAERGISNNPCPLPLNIDADKLPLTPREPLNSVLISFLVVSSTLKRLGSSEPDLYNNEADIEPLAILNASSDNAFSGILNNLLPSPSNDELIIPLAVTLPTISVSPINVCLSSTESPNIFEPDE